MLYMESVYASRKTVGEAAISRLVAGRQEEVEIRRDESRAFWTVSCGAISDSKTEEVSVFIIPVGGDTTVSAD